MATLLPQRQVLTGATDIPRLTLGVDRSSGQLVVVDPDGITVGWIEASFSVEQRTEQIDMTQFGDTTQRLVPGLTEWRVELTVGQMMTVDINQGEASAATEPPAKEPPVPKRVKKVGPSVLDRMP